MYKIIPTAAVLFLAAGAAWADDMFPGMAPMPPSDFHPDMNAPSLFGAPPAGSPQGIINGDFDAMRQGWPSPQMPNFQGPPMGSGMPMSSDPMQQIQDQGMRFMAMRPVNKVHPWEEKKNDPPPEALGAAAPPPEADADSVDLTKKILPPGTDFKGMKRKKAAAPPPPDECAEAPGASSKADGCARPHAHE